MSPRIRLGSSWQFWLSSSFVLVGLLIVSVGDRAAAQIVPDDTLGEEASEVNPLIPGLPIDQITGGAERKSNLFHSFQEFNVGEGRVAVFVSPTPEIQNILARVTGGNPSEILGQLSTIGGNPNLFLINPNGIIFGANARLNIGGSFIATTANGIGFGEQGIFSASDPEAPSPLLTVNPSTFFFNQTPPQAIVNNSAAPRIFDPSQVDGLRVSQGQNLVLVGGNVELAGGQLLAQQGQIEVGGLAEPGIIRLDENLRLSFPDDTARADISLSEGANITANDGDVRIWGRNIILTEGSQVVASNAVSILALPGIPPIVALDNAESIPGGRLTVTATESLTLIGTSADGKLVSGLFTQTGGAGDAGVLTINTGRLVVRDGAQISAATFGEGRGGTLRVNASDFIELSGTTPDGQVSSGLYTQTQARGDAGDLTINTERLLVRNGAIVSSSTFAEGRGGTLTVNASDSIELRGLSSVGNPQASGLFALTREGSGAAGNLIINTGRLTVRDGALVTASTFEGSQGRGGTLVVNASEVVELLGTSSDGQFRSGLLVGTTGNAPAGNLTINTEQLIVRDGATVSATTLGQQPGGTVTITASEFIEPNSSAFPHPRVAGGG